MKKKVIGLMIVFGVLALAVAFFAYERANWGTQADNVLNMVASSVTGDSNANVKAFGKGKDNSLTGEAGAAAGDKGNQVQWGGGK